MKKYHYVYRITNTVLRKHYYGSRTSKIRPNLDLGVIYFSSSTDKNFLKDQKLNQIETMLYYLKCTYMVDLMLLKMITFIINHNKLVLVLCMGVSVKTEKKTYEIK